MVERRIFTLSTLIDHVDLQEEALCSQHQTLPRAERRTVVLQLQLGAALLRSLSESNSFLRMTMRRWNHSSVLLLLLRPIARPISCVRRRYAIRSLCRIAKTSEVGVHNRPNACCLRRTVVHRFLLHAIQHLTTTTTHIINRPSQPDSCSHHSKACRLA